MQRKKIVVGNWKMFTTLHTAQDLAQRIVQEMSQLHFPETAVNALGESIPGGVDVGIAPPFVYLSELAKVVDHHPVLLGAQNLHHENQGAFTGEVSPGMLADIGCKFVIIGHSERRHGFHEPDLFLNRKLKSALLANLMPIFCIGETLAEREAKQTEAVLEYQLDAGLSGITAEQTVHLVLAYEPVWAIGTGKTATPEQAQHAHAFIRNHLAKKFGNDFARVIRLQYGGSVKPENARELLHQPDIDGALVGGASLKADSFMSIVKAAL